MAKITKAAIEAKGIEIAVQTMSGWVDYFSLTDIARFQNPEAPASVINHWMRLHNTIEQMPLGLFQSPADTEAHSLTATYIPSD